MNSPNSRAWFTAEQIAAHADRLARPYAAILQLSNDLTYDGIAAELNLPLGTVKSRLNRARAALRALMDKETANARQGS